MTDQNHGKIVASADYKVRIVKRILDPESYMPGHTGFQEMNVPSDHVETHRLRSYSDCQRDWSCLSVRAWLAF